MGPEVEKGPLPSGLMFSYNLLIKLVIYLIWSFPGGSDDKESACNARDLGSVLGSWLPTPVETTAMKSPCTETRELPPLVTTRESPRTATKTQLSQK